MTVFTMQLLSAAGHLPPVLIKDHQALQWPRPSGASHLAPPQLVLPDPG